MTRIGRTGLRSNAIVKFPPPSDPRSLRVRHRARVCVSLAAAVALTTAVTGCSIFRGSTSDALPPTPAPPAATAGQQAMLQPIGGSAVFGKVRVLDRGDGATVTVSVINIPSGEFRIAIHDTPNCSSPNGFSAGPAWAPAGAARKPAELVPALRANSEGTADVSSRVTGLHANGPGGVAGHSVVVYASSSVTDAIPGVPNDRVACGIFEPVQLFTF